VKDKIVISLRAELVFFQVLEVPQEGLEVQEEAVSVRPTKWAQFLKKC